MLALTITGLLACQECLQVFGASMSVLLRSIIQRYTSYSERDEQHDRKSGSRDAKRSGSAASYQLLELGETALKNAATADVERYQAEHNKQTGIVKAELEECRKKADDLYEQRKDAEAVHQAEITSIEDTWGRASDRYRRLAKRLRDAERSVELIEAEVGHRPLRTSLRRAYLPMMGVMSIMESPINRYAFELFFRNTAAISLGLALMSGMILMFFAHSLGVSIRRFNYSPTILRRIASTLFISFIVILSAALIYGLGLLRQDFTNYVNRTAATGLADLLRKGSFDIRTITDVAASSQLGHDAMVLIGLNIALFLVGMIAAFVRHDPHPDFEAAIKRRSRADQRLARYQSKLDLRFDRARKRHADQLARVGILVHKAEEDLRSKEGELEVLSLTIDNDLKIIQASVARRINAYRFGYLQEAKLAAPTEGSPSPTVTLVPKRS